MTDPEAIAVAHAAPPTPERSRSGSASRRPPGPAERRPAARHARRRPRPDGVFIVTAIFAPAARAVRLRAAESGDGVNFGSQQPPSAEHLLGTTVGGYDVLSRVIWGARPRSSSSSSPSLLSIFIGVALGLCRGYFGGWVDRVARRHRRRDLRVPVAAARHRRRHRDQRRAVEPVGRRAGRGASRSPSCSSRSTSA